MRRISAVAVMAGLAVSLVSPAQAGGLDSPYLDQPAEVYTYAPEPSNGFEGGYIGVVGAAGLINAPVIPDLEVAAVAGYNYVMGNGFMAGAEIDATLNPDSLWGLNVFTGTVDGRLGFLVSDDLMLYGRAGGGYTTGAGGSVVWDLGGGAEYAVTNDIAIRGELDRVDPLAAGMATQLNAKFGVILDF